MKRLFLAWLGVWAIPFGVFGEEKKDQKPVNLNPSIPIDEVLEKQNKMKETEGYGNKPEQLEWLQDAGFGMFIHWNVDCQIGSVISHSLVGASKEYSDWYFDELPKTFNPKRWDADEVARLAKLTGMKYVVFTAKHHSGFCWWDTPSTPFNITKTPYEGDVLGDYCAALRKYGIKVGFYYSPEDFHWLYRNGYTVSRKQPDLPSTDKHPEYSKYIADQLTELMKYEPDILFFDSFENEVAKRTAWEIDPDILITRGAIATPEQHVPGMPPKGVWESNLTMGTQWNYKPTNDDYKSGTRIIEILIETRAKGGACMMNIGPEPNGEIPQPQEDRLREVALWHAVNKEAVHDVRPWVVAREENVWFTRSKDGKDLYVILTREEDWKIGTERSFLLQSVKATEGTEISVLGHGGEVVEYQVDVDPTPSFEQEEGGLRIAVTRGQRLYNNYSWHNPVVAKLTNVEPAFEVPPFAETKDVVAKNTLSGELVELAGAESVEVFFEYQVYKGFAAAMHNTEWEATPAQLVSEVGEFVAKVEGLELGETYQYRAVVKHPKITMRGNHLRFVAE
ncbi:MAG: alpha-L-fucosidase [Verrucomicrobiota bacterium]